MLGCVYGVMLWQSSRPIVLLTCMVVVVALPHAGRIIYCIKTPISVSLWCQWLLVEVMYGHGQLLGFLLICMFFRKNETVGMLRGY